MNKLTDPQPRIYAFVYELGKMDKGELLAYMTEVTAVFYDFRALTHDNFLEKYPEFKLGEEARDAKNKVENLKPTKKKKTTKEK